MVVPTWMDTSLRREIAGLATNGPKRTKRRPYLLAALTWGYMIWSLGPVLIAILFSFNAGASRSVWQGFSTRWWTGAGDSLAHNSVYIHALLHSFLLAALDMVFVVPIGVTLAFFLSRWRGRGAGSLALLASLPLVVPELIIAISLFFLFTHLLSLIHLGTAAQVIGQVTFSLPFITIITRGTLSGISPEVEEAATDLGATPLETFWLIMLPLLQPAILAGAVVAFAISIDDFVITEYLSSTVATQTVPILIYNTARGQATPALNATAAVLALLTLFLVGFGALVYVTSARRRAVALAPSDTIA